MDHQNYFLLSWRGSKFPNYCCTSPFYWRYFWIIWFLFVCCKQKHIYTANRRMTIESFIAQKIWHTTLVLNHGIWNCQEHGTKATPVLHEPLGKHWVYIFLQNLKSAIHFWYSIHAAISKKRCSKYLLLHHTFAVYWQYSLTLWCFFFSCIQWSKNTASSKRQQSVLQL